MASQVRDLNTNGWQLCVDTDQTSCDWQHWLDDKFVNNEI